MATYDNDSTEIMPTVDASIFDTTNTQYIMTVNTDSTEGKLQVLAALNYAAPLKDFVDKPIKVRDCITMPGVRKSRNGGHDTPCQNTYLIDTDGNAYFSQSDGVKRSVLMIFALFPQFGKETENGYIELKLVEQNLANGNTLKNLVPVL
jgi:hypothetical protein